MMSEHYKLYCLDPSGRITRPMWIEANNDEDAIAQARNVEHPHGCELWHNARKVAQLEGSST